MPGGMCPRTTGTHQEDKTNMIADLSHEQLRALLDVLPMELAFIDADDRVRFWNRTEERGPAWKESVLGGHVHQCHKDSSVPAVHGVIAKLKSGARDVVDRRVTTERGITRFRWFAVRSKEGEYLGTLEMVQYGAEVAPGNPPGEGVTDAARQRSVRYTTSGE